MTKEELNKAVVEQLEKMNNDPYEIAMQKAAHECAEISDESIMDIKEKVRKQISNLSAWVGEFPVPEGYEASVKDRKIIIRRIEGLRKEEEK